MTLFEELKKCKEAGEVLTEADLSEGILEQLYWDEEMPATFIADLFGMKISRVRYLINDYGLQLYNKRSMDMFEKMGELMKRMREEMREDIRAEIEKEIEERKKDK
jgi:hypothetical protein